MTGSLSMIVTRPTRRVSRLNSITRTAMPLVRGMARFAVLDCVLVAARETFYPDLPRHSPELTLWRFGTLPVVWALLKAAEWKPTG